MTTIQTFTPPQALISVLVPSYNHAPYIAETINSVLVQTHQNWELIVVDDASEDGSWDVIQSFDDPRIRSRCHAVNEGAVVCLDEALMEAKGDYIAILNSDDCFVPDRLEKLLAFLEHGCYSAVFSDVSFIDAAAQPLADDHPRRFAYQHMLERLSGQLSPSWFLSGNPAVSTSNLLYRRQASRSDWRAFPLRYTHDWAWCLEQSACGELGWLHEPLLRYRVHEYNTVHEPDHWRHRHENAWILSYALDLIAPIAERCQQLAPQPQQHLVDALCSQLLFTQNASPLMVLMMIAFQRINGQQSIGSFSALLPEPQGHWWAEALKLGSGFYDTDPLESLHELLDRQMRERALWDVTADLTAQLVQTKAHPGERVYSMVKLHQELREFTSNLADCQRQIEQMSDQLSCLQLELGRLQRSKLYRLRLAFAKVVRWLCPGSRGLSMTREAVR